MLDASRLSVCMRSSRRCCKVQTQRDRGSMRSGLSGSKSDVSWRLGQPSVRLLSVHFDLLLCGRVFAAFGCLRFTRADTTHVACRSFQISWPIFHHYLHTRGATVLGPRPWLGLLADILAIRAPSPKASADHEQRYACRGAQDVWSSRSPGLHGGGRSTHQRGPLQCLVCMPARPPIYHNML